MVIEACHKESTTIGSCIISIASDGEACRGAALIQITHKAPLNPTSPIYEELTDLELMNLLVGDDDITADKDYKHIWKCLQTLLLHPKGMLVHGTLVTPELLHKHL